MGVGTQIKKTERALGAKAVGLLLAVLPVLVASGTSKAGHEPSVAVDAASVSSELVAMRKIRSGVCKAFEDEKNPIKASKIAQDFKSDGARKMRLEGELTVKGKVKIISVWGDGRLAQLRVETELGTFINDGLTSPNAIRRGSKLYNVMGTLSVGDEITVTGSRIRPTSHVTEWSIVCGDWWSMKYSKISA
jgi:hypothetical protein